MKITYNGARFLAISTYDERHIAKQAGFRWDPDSKRWWTADVTKAARLFDFADEAATAAIKAATAKRQESLVASRATDADIEIPVPEGLALRPFQRAGVAYAMARNATLIADDMGLGKTLQAIGVINADPNVKSALIVVPLSVKVNWQRELDKWLTRDMLIGLASAKEWPDTDVVVIHPDVLKRRPEIHAKTWDLLVVDEAHFFKNAKAQRTVALFGDRSHVAVRARRKIAMTGTPIPNRPVELWPILHSLDPDNWGNWRNFVIRYCAGHQTKWGWDVSGASHLDELQDTLRSTLMIRRRKADVLTELPPKTRQVLVLDPADVTHGAAAVRDEQKAVKDLAKARAEAALAVELAKTEGNDETYKAAVERLRDAASAEFSAISKLRHDTAVIKAPAVANIAREALEGGDDKVAVWAHHHDVIDILVTELAEFRPVVVTGKVSQEERQKAVDAFQSDSKTRVFIGGITAAGVGITLTATSHAIFAELDWVPGNVSQAEDRHHRIGAVDPVLIHHVVLDGSLDAKLAKTIVAKQQVADEALDNKHDPLEPAPQITVPEPVEHVERPSTASVRRERIAALAERITPEITETVHTSLRLLAAMDADRAREQNNAGFSKIDVALGHDLAEREHLSPKQAALGAELARKYRRQLPSASNEVIAAFLAPKRVVQEDDDDELVMAQ